MDEQKRAEIEEKIKNCKMKIANEQAKLTRYQVQLETGKTRHSKTRAKSDQKQTKDISKTGQKPPESKKEKGFFETILS